MFQWWQSLEPGSPLVMQYQNGRGKEIAHRFRATDYRDLTQTMTLDARAHIFSALDQLSPIEREAVAEVWDQVANQRPGVRLLNNPRKVMTRFKLLENLHEEGLNTFRVFHATDVDRVDKFPVFVRSDRRHDGALTALIQDHETLRKSIRALRARGADMDDLMIVEHVDVRDSDGLCRKYAAFRVGSHILPSHVLAAKHWMVKSEDSERDMATALGEQQFQLEGRYNDWIMRVFTLAGIDYGRLDFGVMNGVPQAWEINMQPTIGRGPGEHKPREQNDVTVLLESVRNRFHEGLRNAFAELDDDAVPAPAPLAVRISDHVMTRLLAEREAAARRSRLKQMLSRAYHAPALGRPLRWMYGRLLPRV
ncbi:MAG: hypothetical protein ACO1Q7_09995 [Gemmatimonas sp.]